MTNLIKVKCSLNLLLLVLIKPLRINTTILLCVYKKTWTFITFCVLNVLGSIIVYFGPVWSDGLFRLGPAAIQHQWLPSTLPFLFLQSCNAPDPQLPNL
jgi:hypothetical protein